MAEIHSKVWPGSEESERTPFAQKRNQTWSSGESRSEDPWPAAEPASQTQFIAIYSAFVERIYGFVFSHVGNLEDAEDITSQVFIKAYKGLGKFEARGSLDGWLFQVARSAMADFWRERYKLAAVPLADSWDVATPRTIPDYGQAAREERVRQLLGALPANYRDVLAQRFLMRASIRDAARALGISEANARVLQFRALRKAAEVAHELGW